MRSYLKWSSELPEHEGEKAITALCYSPQGSHIVAASSNRVLMYDANSGVLMKKLPQGHNSTIYCLSYSSDGKRFASGGADNLVIIWSSSGDGKLRYPHNDSIQALAYNPVTQQLASCSSSDFGLYSPEQTEVRKFRVKNKILCCSWTNDGQHLALGHFNGRITIVNKEGQEKLTIKRPGSPIWTLGWNPCREEPDILAVGCWDETLSFYHLSGKQAGKDRKLGYDPCALVYFNNGEYFLMGGSDKKCTLWKKEGIKLLTVSEESNWVWSISQSPSNNFVAVGTEDGKIKVYQCIFSVVHGLHGDMYAYRDFMTDVVVRDLINETTTRIECRDYVKKIAVFKDKLAIQLSKKINVYDLFKNSDDEIQSRIRAKIPKELECNLLLVTGEHVVLCHEKYIETYNFKGVKEREWQFDEGIKYTKVVGGPSGAEGLLIGSKSGEVIMVFINNPFPIIMFKHSIPIRCVDLSRNRNKLALVDEKLEMIIYDLEVSKVMYKETKINTVSWNADFNNMFCYSNGEHLFIKVGDFPPSKYKFEGLIVGFKGSKIYGLLSSSLKTIEIPHTENLKLYIRQKNFKKAYRIACLGVTEKDWRDLAFASLLQLNFHISKKAFIRIRDVKYIDLIDKFEDAIYRKKYNEKLFLGEIYASMGNFAKAEEMFMDSGNGKMAIDMYCDLRMWSEAQQIAKILAKRSKDKNILLDDLVLLQAKEAENDGDYKEAASLYTICGKFKKSIELQAEHKWAKWEDDMIDLCRSLNKETHEQEIQLCVKALKENKVYKFLVEIYQRLKDYKALADIFIQLGEWDRANKLIEKDSKVKSIVLKEYAKHLMSTGKFIEAIKMLEEAGEPEEVIKMIEILAHNAIIENRFNDAAKYFSKLAFSVLKRIDRKTQDKPLIKQMLIKFGKYQRQSHIYYSYDYITKYCESPFSSVDPKRLFNMARYLLMNTMKETPYGISKVYVVLTLSRLGESLGNFKFARDSYQRLQRLKLPKRLIDDVELER